MKVAGQCFARRVGRRGVFLLFMGLLSVVTSFGVFAAPSTTQTEALGRLVPLPVWGVMWAVTGLLCIVEAFRSVDWPAFIAAFASTMMWSALYFTSWAMGIVDRGWSGGAVYLGFATLVAVVSTWPEPVDHRLILARAKPSALISANADGLITGWTGSAEEMFGRPALEAIGQDVSILMPERLRGAHHSGMARVVNTKVTRAAGQIVESFGLHSSGSEFPVRILISVTDTGAEVLFTAVIGGV